MRRVFLIALGIGAVLILVAFLALGAFPPKLNPHDVREQIPTDSIAVPNAPAANAGAETQPGQATPPGASASAPPPGRVTPGGAAH